MIVEVKTPSRLHLGLIELGGHHGRIYGGIGVAIKKPSLHIKVEKSDELKIQGPCSKHVSDIVARLAKNLGIDFSGRIQVLNHIPVHKGLGSMTQLSLAVGTALVKIHGLAIEPEKLAALLGRGRISCVGTAVFKEGGFILDFPRKNPAGLCSRYLRFEFPEEWAFLVAYPIERSGPDDEAEQQLFKRLPVMDEHKCSKISHIVLFDLLPSLMERDAESFGRALTGLQTLVGEHFAALQGGRFVSEEAVEVVVKYGALGAGQSSWGPAVYGFYSSFKEASKAAEKVSQELGAGWEIFVTEAVNEGAKLSVAP
ncbi:MAG: hypothetical protein QXU87_04275 [Candidatus Caldarchaeum sp.]